MGQISIKIFTIFRARTITSINDKRKLINYYCDVSQNIIGQFFDILKTEEIMYKELVTQLSHIENHKFPI